MGQEFFRISELNNYIKDVIQAGFPQPLWVCGEIQGYDRNKNKPHVFFELVEKNPDSNDIIAKIGLVIFSGRKSHIEKVLKQTQNAFSLKDDIEVKFLCKIDFYAPHGAVRLAVEDIDPVYTLGKLAQEKQKLIALLKQKGVFDKNKLLQLPLVPLHIGLITADDSAAYNDFCSELSKSGFGFKVFLRNALMQGKKTEADVSQAIQELQKLDFLDVIVITRGGGSLADLSYFDSQLIAETIAACQLPVLSGIGHEINITITDLAAHTYAKTPTAIAQFLVEGVHQFLEATQEKIEKIFDLALGRIEEQSHHLKDYAVRLQSGTQTYFKEHEEKIIRWQEVLKGRPSVLLRDYGKNLSRIQDDLSKRVRMTLQNEQLKLKNYTKMIGLLHPVNTLKRGFSITRNKEGRVIKTISEIKAEDRIETQFIDGRLESQAVSIKKGVKLWEN